MSKFLKVLSAFLIVLFSSTAFGQSPIGKWKTIDDETGKPKSVVEIYEKNGKLYGKVIKLFRAPNEDQNPVCQNCPGDRKAMKVLGLEIIRGMKKDGSEWADGTILDPKNGKVYDCKMWVENGKLQVRGYIAFFFRTQVWVPYKD